MNVVREESWDSLTFIDPNSEEELAKDPEKKQTGGQEANQ